MKRLALLGASGHGKVIAEIAELNGWAVDFFDDACFDQKMLEHWRIVGDFQSMLHRLRQYSGCFVAIGDNAIRLEKIKQLQKNDAHLPILIHPKAVVSQYAIIASASVVMAQACVNSFARIGVGAIINTGATIDHDCCLGDAVHISPGAHLAGSVQVGGQSWVGIGAAVKQCMRIGRNVIVGAGAVVIEDCPDNVMTVGIPAKIKTKD